MLSVLKLKQFLLSAEHTMTIYFYFKELFPLDCLRHPKGGSFVRPAKVSFGVDYLTAVQQIYQIDTEEVLSEEIAISSKTLEWGSIKERRYEAQSAV